MWIVVYFVMYINVVCKIEIVWYIVFPMHRQPLHVTRALQGAAHTGTSPVPSTTNPSRHLPKITVRRYSFNLKTTIHDWRRDNSPHHQEQKPVASEPDLGHCSTYEKERRQVKRVKHPHVG